MIRPDQLTKEVEFDSSFDPSSLQYDEQLGFMHVYDASVAINGLRLLGFGVPIARTGGFDTADVVRPLTRFEELPKLHQTIDEQGKGVGPRMYNIREALAGAKSRPSTVGVYTFDLHPDKLLDLRAMQGAKITRIARHGFRMIHAAITDTETVVDGIHKSYGDADAVLLEMPPLPELRQVRHHVSNPVGITPEFVVVRNPNISLHKVGETPAPW